MFKIRSVVMGLVLALGLVTGFASPASAGKLYWKTGKAVSHSKVFDGANTKNIICYGNGEIAATMCIRLDRRTMYVRSDKADGYFKLGSWKGSGNQYVCQNNKGNKKGNGTWVACHWKWPKKKCYTTRTGHGQADWYILSRASSLYCY
ncbi:hypothetical protein [Micromonospora sp. KC213]|uniref:hypothetical protein n=1 Tax=Micromonospora sp. KC213 TaxID=2530378 RepID=UPI001053B11C|nr:hypothetical protein [Micromonospora sp. KC213]TDC43977.1 hypothetical protein E1166_01780 [Micromonospora sp. KC213]